MKKLSLIFLIAAMFIFTVSTATLAQVPGYWDLKAGLDFGGKIDIDGAYGSDDVDTGLTLIGEYKVPYRNGWTLGGGLRYQLDREIDASGDPEFSFMPIYALAEYDFMNNPYYMFGQLGYNTFDMDNLPGYSVDDTSGGLYYAVGAGMDLSNTMTAEVMYSVNNGEADLNGNSEDLDYSKLTVSLGVKF
ncbi:outer membrane beta-barrel protein [Halanaerobium salsuginis]|uniref:Outer membrane protein beta-barrel domain-containing protein n=1 Tax=Halanaerobium salsuginis TaxID=29563 RepID=A0A1I4MT95_9FIRM|nr:outer membrane beta-barrel protein [Halanaerobium salsuginis]SFM06479.1 Outer membrane protein beta-barrel domain-containing protein [Halanaerobium salsuginis]